MRKLFFRKNIIVMTLLGLGIILGASQEIPSLEQTLSLEGNSLEYQKWGKLTETSPLIGESEESLKLFNKIIKSFSRLPRDPAARVTAYRRLLIQVDAVKANTSFLQGQKEIVSSVLRYKLGIRGTAAKNMITLVDTSPYTAIRMEAAQIFLDEALLNSETNAIKSFYQNYQNRLPESVNLYTKLLIKEPQDITPEELDFLMNQIVEAPRGTFQEPNTIIRILGRYKNNLEPSQIDRLIRQKLREGYDPIIVPLIMLRLNLQNVSFEQLVFWGQKLQVHEHELAKAIQQFRNKTEDQNRYLSFYNKRISAVGRGRVYYRKLSRYQGYPKNPYNVYQVDKIFSEYLKGKIEEKYLVKNTEYAFRNFLAYKKYDKIIHYAEKIRQNMWSDYMSPYINFWEAYALMETGDTNLALPLLADIVAVAPESYFGIVARQELIKILASPKYSKGKLLTLFKERSGNDLDKQASYATLLYYIGNLVDRNTARSLFNELNILYTRPKKQIPLHQKILMEAYLNLGLEKDARRILFQEGIKEIYNQDSILGLHYQRSNKEESLRRILSRMIVPRTERKTMEFSPESLFVYYPKPYFEELKTIKGKIPYNVDPALVYAIMRTESFYKPRARSHVGAKGLMQLMPVTAKYLAETLMPREKTLNVYDPEINMFLGTYYLYDYIDRIGLLSAIAAYNGGPTRIRRLTKQFAPATDIALVEILPMKETRDYVHKVIESYYRYKIIYDGKFEEIGMRYSF